MKRSHRVWGSVPHVLFFQGVMATVCQGEGMAVWKACSG